MDRSGTGCLGFSLAASRAAGLAPGARLHDGQFTVAGVHTAGFDEGNRVARREAVLKGLVELVFDLGFEGLVALVGHVPLRVGANGLPRCGSCRRKCQSNKGPTPGIIGGWPRQAAKRTPPRSRIAAAAGNGPPR